MLTWESIIFQLPNNNFACMMQEGLKIKTPVETGVGTQRYKGQMELY
jgi:hypothetical protein